MTEVTPDWKPRRRVLDSEASSRKLARDPECRICRVPATDGHHVVLRSQGGDDVEDNIVPLCHGCHMAYHDGKGRIRLRLDELAYVRERLGGAASAYLRKRRCVA